MTRSQQRGKEALAAWDRWRWTNALLAVDPDPAGGDGPLAGVAVSVKDVYETAGLVSAAGSLLLRNHRPARDAVAVGRLRRAGAAIVAKANCAEFGIGTDTDTRLGGRVLHPFDPSVSPGGSSGGDAVAVATGVVDLAVGGDYGGSVRWPAQSVGVYGLRTSAGLVPRTGRIPGAAATPTDPAGLPPWPATLQGRLEVVGLLAADLAVLREGLRHVAGSDGVDWGGLTVQPSDRPWTRRLAVTTGQEIAPVGPEAARALNAAVAAARAAGFEVLDAAGLFADAYPAYVALRAWLDDYRDVSAVVAGGEDLVCDDTRALLHAPPPPSYADPAVADAWRTAATVTARIRRLLETVDGLLLPVAPVPAAAHGAGAGAEIGGRRIKRVDLMAHCRAVSLTGMPTMSLPVLPLGPGRSVSVQLVGSAGEDDRCCALAARLARHLDVPIPPRVPSTPASFPQ